MYLCTRRQKRVANSAHHRLCVLYFTCILFLFFAVTVCECHIEMKGYLLTYLGVSSIPSSAVTVVSCLNEFRHLMC